MKAYEIKYLKKLILADDFSDIEALGIEFNKEDFEPTNSSQNIEA